MDEHEGNQSTGVRDTNDPMTLHGQGAGVWGDPSAPSDDVPAELPPEQFNYGAGMFVDVVQDADAIPGSVHPMIVAKLGTDQPAKSYETLHEATHRRYDAPFTLPINQAAAGFTKLVPPKMGLHFIKLLACVITLDAAGTIKFVQGSEDGLVTADLSGAMNAGGAAAPQLTLAPAPIETPWFYTAPDLALGIFTGAGKAQGFVTCCYSPYDA